MGECGLAVPANFVSFATQELSSTFDFCPCLNAINTGYQQRIAPADEPLTEANFQKNPLRFAGNPSLRWNGTNGRSLSFNGTYVSEGTVPTGSTWARNPLPRVDSAKAPTSWDAFPAPCYDPNPPADGGYGGLCSGWYGPDNLEIVDAVRIPAHLTAGKYVLQW
jgi:hypothetical protein